MLQASSQPGDWVLDFFAGSGTLGAAATGLDRRFVLIDHHADAIATIQTRLTAICPPGTVHFLNLPSATPEPDPLA